MFLTFGFCVEQFIGEQAFRGGKRGIALNR